MRFRHKIISLLLCVLAFMAMSTPAMSQPIILELFTSQSCKDCVAADKLLYQIARKKPHIITLTCNVDYWNYTGWQDTLSKRFCTDRQLHYSLLGGRQGKLNTPELIMNGRLSLDGTKSYELSNAIARSNDRITSINLKLEKDMLHMNIPDITLKKNTAASINLIFYGYHHTELIKDGVNRGEKLTYTHPIQSIDILHTSWQGEAINTTLSVGQQRIDKAAGLLVLIQTGGGKTSAGPIIAVGHIIVR